MFRGTDARMGKACFCWRFIAGQMAAHLVGRPGNKAFLKGGQGGLLSLCADNWKEAGAEYQPQPTKGFERRRKRALLCPGAGGRRKREKWRPATNRKIKCGGNEKLCQQQGVNGGKGFAFPCVGEERAHCRMENYRTSSGKGASPAVCPFFALRGIDALAENRIEVKLRLLFDAGRKGLALANGG